MVQRPPRRFLYHLKNPYNLCQQLNIHTATRLLIALGGQHNNKSGVEEGENEEAGLFAAAAG